MRRFVALLATVVAVAVAVSLTIIPASASVPLADGIQGAWRSVEVTVTNAEGTNTNPITQANMTIYSAGHYSSIRVTGQENRELLPEEATDEQLLAAWRPFAANAGTYTLDGTTLTTRVMVAKSPNAMAESRENSSEVVIEGNVMYQTFTNAENGNSFRVKSERLD